MKSVILSVLTTATLVYGESSVGLNINNDDVELSSSIDVSRLGGYSEGAAFSIDANYLHTANDNLFGLGVSGESQTPGIEGLTVGAGIKSVWADNYIAVPLFLRAAYALPFGSSFPTTSVGGYFAYAPSVLSFSDADAYREWRVQLDMEVASSIHLFGGYRDINTHYETYNYNFNDSFYGGLKLSF